VKILKFMFKYIRIFFIFALIVSVIFNATAFTFMQKSVLLYLTIFYYILLGVTIISFYMYRSDKINNILLVILPFALGLSSAPHKLITLILILPVFFLKGYEIIARIVLILFYMLVLTLGYVLSGFMAFVDIGKDTVLNQTYSPDKKFRIDVIDSDQGALGGDTYVDLYKEYFNLVQQKIKIIYHGPYGDKPKVKWLDNENVIINESIKLNIHNSPMWENEKHNNQ